MAAELARLTQQIAGDQEQVRELTERLQQLSAPHATLAQALEHARSRSAGLEHAVELLREQQNLTAELREAQSALAQAQATEAPGADEPAALEDRLAARARRPTSAPRRRPLRLRSVAAPHQPAAGGRGGHRAARGP